MICKEEINVCYKGANKILITVAELQNHALLFGSIKLYLLVLSKINWPPEQLSNQLSNACNKIHTCIERIFGIQPQMSQLLKELQVCAFIICVINYCYMVVLESFFSNICV